MYRFIYQNKKTGAKVYSNEKLDNENLELLSEIKTVDIKQNQIRQT